MKKQNIILKIKNFFHKFIRSCRWFNRMWNNHDFDYSFLLKTIVWKMKDMLYQLDVVDKNIVDLRNQVQYKDNGYNGDLLKSLEECIEIGERIIEDDYITYPDIVKEWLSQNSIAEKIPEDVNKLLLESYNEADKKKEDDIERFFNIFKNNYMGWWS